MVNHSMPLALMFASFAVGLAEISSRLSHPPMFAAALPSVDFAALAATLGAIAAALMAAAKALEAAAKFIASFRTPVPTPDSKPAPPPAD